MTKRKKKPPEETAIIPADGLGLLRRGKDGLMTIQRMLLEELMEEGGSWRKACQKLDIKERRVRFWLTNDDAFSEAYDKLLGSVDITATKKELDYLASGAAELYEEAMQATRGAKVDTKCPKCGKEFEVHAAAPDHRIRMKAMETLLKISGTLKETRKVEGQLLNISLTGDEIIALMAYQVGQPVPESVLAALREKGVID